MARSKSSPQRRVQLKARYEARLKSKVPATRVAASYPDQYLEILERLEETDEELDGEERIAFELSRLETLIHYNGMKVKQLQEEKVDKESMIPMEADLAGLCLKVGKLEGAPKVAGCHDVVMEYMSALEGMTSVLTTAVNCSVKMQALRVTLERKLYEAGKAIVADIREHYMNFNGQDEDLEVAKYLLNMITSEIGEQ